MQKRKTPLECLEFMNNIAQQNGSELLDKQWKGVYHKYSFKNHIGVIFYRTYLNVKKLSWPQNWKSFLQYNSPSRRKNKSKLELLREIKNLAVKNKGLCLSNQWLGIHIPHLFQDEYGFQFNLKPSSLKKGGWTPNRGLVSEPICHQIFEHLFQCQFIKTREVLTGKLLDRKTNLELDGFCKELNIAFEYQGHSSHWDINNKNYIEITNRDLLKKEWCTKLNIILIQVPKFPFTNFSQSDCYLLFVKNIIKDIFTNLNLNIPKFNDKPFHIDFSKINYAQEQLSFLKNLALDNNCKLLSKKWYGFEYTYDFEDYNKQKFSLSLKNYHSNGWPKNILKYNNHQKGHKKSFQELYSEIVQIADYNHLILLDKEWKGNYHLYSLQESNGKIIKKSAQNIKRNHNSLKKALIFSIDNLNKIVSFHNVHIINTKWVNKYYLYIFKFNNNTYRIPAIDIITHGWPEKTLDKFLIKEIPKTIYKDYYEELVQFAEKHNGKVLTPNWLGNKILHKFMTEDGIIFEKKPINIKRSGWYK